MAAVWFVAVGAPGMRAEWDFATLGEPEVCELHPVRRPTSGAFSRNIPVAAYSVTTGSHHELESGLEHDLLRSLDRRAEVDWLLAQPTVLHFPRDLPGRTPTHTPDLLSRNTMSGAITLWDARPQERHDEMFERKAGLTRQACFAVGWDYQVFDGLTRPERMNMLWLNGFRHSSPWAETRQPELQQFLTPSPRPIGDILDHDDGSGELTSTMWHLIWTGKISCDLTLKIDRSTALTWGSQ